MLAVLKEVKDMSPAEYDVWCAMDDETMEEWDSEMVSWRHHRNLNAPLPSKDKIELALQSAADRCKFGGATKAQVKYLAALLFENGRGANDVGCSIANSNALLSGVVAQNFIDDYKGK